MYAGRINLVLFHFNNCVISLRYALSSLTFLIYSSETEAVQ
jgi:hypothetical protein